MSIGSDILGTLPADDVPMRPEAHNSQADRVFHGMASVAAFISLVIVGATLIFLINGSRPALAHASIGKFFTTSVWNPGLGNFGVLGLLEGTLIIATIAMVLGVPLGVGMALFINEYSPSRLRRPLTTTVDLLAALPSLLFGIWGLHALEAFLVPVSRFLSAHFSALPFMRVTSDELVGSSFIAGVVLSIMILPIVTSVTRDVMAQVPREQCEGALALGGTRWGMIRQVILPFSRGGIVGGALLGFGRALGETIAVVILISPQIKANTHVLQGGASSVASWIAFHFGEADSLERSGLVAAGLALFILTLIVNLIARVIVRKSQ